ncbi:MAG: hypothetical protein IVW55_11780 [Chloroflexi bacterium]|nr:hypothetical protein [Chloroflexota bacterium]
MYDLSLLMSDLSFRLGEVVMPAPELLAVQVDDGTSVACERLGPGVVEQLAEDERVRVHWAPADLHSWMEPGDIRSAGEDAHLISIYRYDRHEQLRSVRHRVVAARGFSCNWTAELRTGIVRVVSAGGEAWTFTILPVFHTIRTTSWDMPPTDEDAEAITVAELALSG